MTSFAACDPYETFYPKWIGEYSIESIKTWCPDGFYVEQLMKEGIYRETNPDSYVIEHERSYEDYPPLSIYEDKGLYVQVIGIGDPFNPEVDPASQAIFVKSPKCHVTNNGSINDTEPTINFIVRIDGVGKVYTIYNGMMILPKSIKVLRASSDSLVLKNGERFELTLADRDGTIIENAQACWKYSPIKKDNNLCTWDAELHIYHKNIEQPDIWRHHLIFNKK